MTVEDATMQGARGTGTIPGPRTTEPTGPVVDALGLGRRPAQRTRPRSEYWDVETARWVTRSPVPGPRRS